MSYIGFCKEFHLDPGKLSGNYNSIEVHKTENDLFINKGGGSLTVAYCEDESTGLWKESILNPGDCFFVPAGVFHRRKLTRFDEKCIAVVIKIPIK